MMNVEWGMYIPKLSPIYLIHLIFFEIESFLSLLGLELTKYARLAGQ